LDFRRKKKNAHLRDSKWQGFSYTVGLTTVEEKKMDIAVQYHLAFVYQNTISDRLISLPILKL
jgi:hypothetical protein